MYRYRKRVLGVLALLILVSLVALPPTGAASQQEEANSDWELLLEVVQHVQRFYLNESNEHDLWMGAIRGIIDSLEDPYSEYMDPEAYDAFMSHFESDFGGVGMRVQKVGDYVTVVAPIDGTPAARAGLKAGDRIISVDRRDVVGSNLSKVVDLIRGEPGTDVTLVILRGDDDQRLTFTLTRATIEVPSLDSELVEPGIGYLRLRTFSEKSGEEVGEALSQLREKGAQAYVLDLRNNPGGLLSSAVKVAGQFLPPGPVVKVVDKGQKPNELGYDNETPEGIVVVLINEGSASASEIVAGALRDRGYGVLVGVDTYGKGTVQSLIRLSNGGALKLTTAEYLLPSGTAIDGKGLNPDIAVEGQDKQLDRALELLRSMLPLIDGTEGLGVTFMAGQPVVIQEGGLVAIQGAAFVEGGAFYVPVRSMSRLYDADVLWNPETMETRVEVNEAQFTIAPGSRWVKTAAGTTLELADEVLVRDGRTYVPAEFLKKALELMLRFNQGEGSLQAY
jgi:carboxyl-terminal processing protease